MGLNQGKGNERNPCFVSYVENYVSVHSCCNHSPLQEHQSIFEVNQLKFPRTLC